MARTAVQFQLLPAERTAKFPFFNQIAAYNRVFKSPDGTDTMYAPGCFRKFMQEPGLANKVQVIFDTESDHGFAFREGDEQFIFGFWPDVRANIIVWGSHR